MTDPNEAAFYLFTLLAAVCYGLAHVVIMIASAT